MDTQMTDVVPQSFFPPEPGQQQQMPPHGVDGAAYQEKPPFPASPSTQEVQPSNTNGFANRLGLPMNHGGSATQQQPSPFAVGASAARQGQPPSPNGFTNGFTKGFSDAFSNGFTNEFSSGFTNDFTNEFTNEFTNGFTNDFSNNFSNDFTNDFTNSFINNPTNGFDFPMTDGSPAFQQHPLPFGTSHPAAQPMQPCGDINQYSFLNNTVNPQLLMGSDDPPATQPCTQAYTQPFDTNPAALQKIPPNVNGCGSGGNSSDTTEDKLRNTFTANVNTPPLSSFARLDGGTFSSASPGSSTWDLQTHGALQPPTSQAKSQANSTHAAPLPQMDEGSKMGVEFPELGFPLEGFLSAGLKPFFQKYNLPVKPFVPHASIIEAALLRGSGADREFSWVVDIYHDNRKNVETRFFGGAMIQYGDGYSIQSVTPQHKYRVVRFVEDEIDANKSLTLSPIDKSVVSGAPVSAVRMVQPTSIGYRHVTTDLIVPDTESYKSDFHIGPNYPVKGMTLEGDASRPWCHSSTVATKVVFSWEPVTGLQTAVLFYKTLPAMHTAGQGFTKGKFTRVSKLAYAVEETMCATISRSCPYQLLLHGVPQNTKKDTILSGIPPKHRPKGMVLGSSHPALKLSRTSRGLALLLKSIDPSASITASAPPLDNTNEKAVEYQATFANEALAAQAVETLNDTEHKFMQGKLSARILPTICWQVAGTVLKATQGRLPHFNGVSSRFSVTFGQDVNGLVPMCMEAPEGDDLTKVKKYVDRVLDGGLVMVRDEPFWTAELDSSMGPLDQLENIGEVHKVAMVRNMTKKEIRLFGENDACQAAAAAIAKVFSPNVPYTQSTPLRMEDFNAFYTQGLNSVRKLVEPVPYVTPHVTEAHPFNMELKGRNLITHGTPQDLLCVEGVIEAALIWGKFHDEAKLRCSAGSHKVVRPISAQCGHLYCVSCFMNLSIMPIGGYGPVICCAAPVAPHTSCKVPFRMSDLKRSLDTKDYEECLYRLGVHALDARGMATCSDSCYQVYTAEAVEAKGKGKETYGAEKARESSASASSAPARPVKVHKCHECVRVTCMSCGERHEQGGCRGPRSWRQTIWQKHRIGCSIVTHNKTVVDGRGHRWCSLCNQVHCWESMIGKEMLKGNQVWLHTPYFEE